MIGKLLSFHTNRQVRITQNMDNKWQKIQITQSTNNTELSYYRSMKMQSLLSKYKKEKKSSSFNFSFSHFYVLLVFQTRVYQDNKVKIFKNIWRIIKSCSIISLYIFILANPFDLILKFTLVTSSFYNVFYFLLFFISNNNCEWGRIDLIDSQIYRYFLT